MSHELTDRHWDVIVIGTGMGGGTAGRALAEAGLKVLFVEKGPAGWRAERTALNHDIFVPEARLARGLWPGLFTARIDGVEQSLYAPLGAGVGGSSAFYAATLERPEPHDLDDSAARPHPTGGWPVSFAEFAPWLDRAAAHYHVSGEADPLSTTAATTTTAAALRPPRPLSDGDARITTRLRANGLHPYALHSAIDRVEGCHDCLGHKCPRVCRMDGRSAGVEPALASGNAALMDRTDVTRLVGDGQRITGLEARRNGASLTLSADHVLLAGGALGSPRLCLASASEAFPNGVANASGLVGRGLMFHLNEMFAIWPGGNDPTPSKAVGLRDLYWKDGQRLGMVQAMGIAASYGEIAWYLKGLVERSALRRIPGAAGMTRLPAAIAARLLGTAKIFVGLMEDLPYDQNRVLPPAANRDDIAVDYTLTEELHARRRLFRREISRAFRGQRRMFLTRWPELNFGHPCGTMRFGHDPARSVLDAQGRAHGIANLWGADAGFFPTSMGVNPSLTIAAQALRVADAIIREGQHGTQ